MIVMAGLCVAAALITAVFVTDDRRHGRPAIHRAGHWTDRWAVHWADHRLVPRAPENGCPPPVPALADTEPAHTEPANTEPANTVLVTQEES
jgi:hypothetical protein